MAQPQAPDIASLLQPTFAAVHARAAVRHFQAMTEEFQREAWEETIAKSGKVVEAVLKALYVYALNPTLPPSRDFKVDKVLQALEQLPKGSHPDSIRLTIPRACRFAYDIASNRGARHDPDEINANRMDARSVVAIASWILAELLRQAGKGTGNDDELAELVDALTARQYTFMETVDGIVYFHVPKAGARDIGLLTLWQKHPGRVSRAHLIKAIEAHHFTSKNASVAVERLRKVSHCAGDDFRLLQPGVIEAEELFRARRGRAKPKRRPRRRVRGTEQMV